MDHILRQLLGTTGKHSRWPNSGDGDSDPFSPPDPDNPHLPRHKPELIPIPLAMDDAQGEFVQERQAMQAPAQERRQNQADDSTDGHWVTINHRHVFIHEGDHANIDRRTRIAQTAKQHQGDTSMPYTPGHPTCNLFVGKVIPNRVRQILW